MVQYTCNKQWFYETAGAGTVRCSDQNTVNDYFTLSTITYFDWFPLHTRIKEKHRLVLILLTVCTEILITLCITIRDEHDALFD